MFKIREIIQHNKRRRNLNRLQIDNQKDNRLIIRHSNNTIIKPFILYPITQTDNPYYDSPERHTTLRQDQSKSKIAKLHGYQKLSLQKANPRHLISYKGSFSFSLDRCHLHDRSFKSESVQKKGCSKFCLPKDQLKVFGWNGKNEPFERQTRRESPRIIKLSERRVNHKVRIRQIVAEEQERQDFEDIIGWQALD